MDSARVKCTVVNVRVIGVRGCLPDKYRLNSDLFAVRLPSANRKKFELNGPLLRARELVTLWDTRPSRSFAEAN